MRKKKIDALKAKTVARGATVAEAKAAAAKVAELSQDDRRAEARAFLQTLGWSPAHAAGIVTGLNTIPPWSKTTRWRSELLFDWCSANQGLDFTALEPQLRFLSEDLRNSHYLVGSAITAATTEAEAAKAFEPYSKKSNGG